MKINADSKILVTPFDLLTSMEKGASGNYTEQIRNFVREGEEFSFQVAGKGKKEKITLDYYAS